MSFQTLLQHTIKVYRNLPNGIGSQKSYQLVKQGQKAMIQPVDAEYANKINSAFGRTYKLFVPLGVNVQISDKITDQDGKEYRVTGSLNRNYGANSHITFIITEQVQATPDQ